jgi:hypothetical protein
MGLATVLSPLARRALATATVKVTVIRCPRMSGTSGLDGALSVEAEVLEAALNDLFG